jgi:hypothetical protein
MAETTNTNAPTAESVADKAPIKRHPLKDVVRKVSKFILPVVATTVVATGAIGCAPSPASPSETNSTPQTTSETILTPDQIRTKDVQAAAEKTYDIYSSLLNNIHDSDKATILTNGVLTNPQESGEIDVLSTYDYFNKVLGIGIGSQAGPNTSSVLTVAAESDGSDISISSKNALDLYQKAKSTDVDSYDTAAELVSLAMSQKVDLNYVLSLYDEVNKSGNFGKEGNYVPIVYAVLMSKDRNLDEITKIYNQIEDIGSFSLVDGDPAAQLTGSVVLAGGDVQKVLDIYNQEKKTYNSSVNAVWPILTMASIVDGYNVSEINSIYDYFKTKNEYNTQRAASLTLATAAQIRLPGVSADEAAGIDANKVVAPIPPLPIFIPIFIPPPLPAGEP